MNPCFGYIRVSTVKQGDGASLEAQKDSISAFASRNQITITEWFEEKETAAKSGRPIFDQMLKRLRSGEAQGMVIHKIDRSARNLRDWATISEMSDAGIDVYFATESYDFRSRGGRLTADIQAVIAADYIRNLREECIKGLQGRLKQGIYPFRAPIGYLDTGSGNLKRPCPEKAPLIQELFELYGSQQYSLRSLMPEMHRRGLRNHRGGPISLNGMSTILRNPFYTGLIKIKRTGETYPGAHKPIISPALFSRVQSVLSGRAGPKVTRHDHLFQGVFRCGFCNGPMVPELQKGNVYYRCKATTCATKTIREETLEVAIVNCLSSLQPSRKNRTKIDETSTSGDAAQRVDELRHSIELRISDQKCRLSKLSDLLVDELLDIDTYKEKKTAIETELINLREELVDLPDIEEILSQRRMFAELRKTLATLYISAERAEKRQIIENCWPNPKVVGSKPVLEPYSWLERGEFGVGVLDCEDVRDRGRTSDLPKEVKRLFSLFSELLEDAA